MPIPDHSPSPELRSTLVHFRTVFSRTDSCDDLADRLTCTELDALAELLIALGAPEAAANWLIAHASTDEPGDMHYFASLESDVSAMAPETSPTEATIGEIMAALEAVTDAVAADHWFSYHVAVRHAVQLGIADELIADAYQVSADRDGPRSFTIPAPRVTSWRGKHSGLTLVHCAVCDWNEHSLDAHTMHSRAQEHRCPRTTTANRP